MIERMGNREGEGEQEKWKVVEGVKLFEIGYLPSWRWHVCVCKYTHWPQPVCVTD